MRRPAQASFGNPLAEALDLQRRGKLNPAKKICKEVLARQPNNFDALEILGGLLGETGELSEAAKVLSRATALNPRSLSAQFNLGNALRLLKRFAEAEVCYRKALELSQPHTEVYLNLGSCLFEQGRLAEAAEMQRRAAELSPRSANAHFNLGKSLWGLQRIAEAAESFRQAIALEPDSWDGHMELGRCLEALGRSSEAVESYRRCSLAAPKSHEPLFSMGSLLTRLNKLPEALEVLERAVALKPDALNALLALITVKKRLCDWDDIDRLEAAVIKRVKRSEESLNPFQLMAFADEPDLHLHAARQFTRGVTQAAPPPGNVVLSSSPKIRIGYFSADFRDHAVAHVFVGLIERHDKSKFEVHAFGYGWRDESPVRQRIRTAAHAFHDCVGKEPPALVAEAQASGLDIAVDLTGYTEGDSAWLFAQRLAPIQCGYLGYAGSLGVPWMDYLIADRFVVPDGADTNYTEKIVRLPGFYLPTDPDGYPRRPRPSRATYDLPEEAFVFAAFNNTYKYTPPVFAVWMRLLKAVPGSVLWLSGGQPAIQQNLRKQAEKYDVSGDRLIFAGFVKDRADYLARQQCADLFLDSAPYTAHSTACDMLWAGLPIVTWAGRSFSSRVAGSALHAVGMPDLVATTLADYEALALKLATSPAVLADVRDRLGRNRATAPLFDQKSHTRHIEDAFARMMKLAAEATGPQAFDISAIA